MCTGSKHTPTLVIPSKLLTPQGEAVPFSSPKPHPLPFPSLHPLQQLFAFCATKNELYMERPLHQFVETNMKGCSLYCLWFYLFNLNIYARPENKLPRLSLVYDQVSLVTIITSFFMSFHDMQI